MEEKKLASNGILWKFAIGQMGWAALAGVISNCLVFYYMPEDSLLEQGQTLFITQSAVFLGFLTVIGGITALGRQRVFRAYDLGEDTVIVEDAIRNFLSERPSVLIAQKGALRRGSRGFVMSTAEQRMSRFVT